jgi:hypothetical protein
MSEYVYFVVSWGWCGIKWSHALTVGWYCLVKLDFNFFLGGGGEFNWVRQSAAGLPLRSSGFFPWPVDDGLVVDEMALAREFLRVIRIFPCVSFHRRSTSLFHTSTTSTIHPSTADNINYNTSFLTVKTFTYLILPYYSKIFCYSSLPHSFYSVYVFICSLLSSLEEEGSCKFYFFF